VSYLKQDLNVSQLQNLAKIHPVGVVPRGRTDMTRPVRIVIRFANAPKRLKCQSYAVRLYETRNLVEILVGNNRMKIRLCTRIAVDAPVVLKLMLRHSVECEVCSDCPSDMFVHSLDVSQNDQERFPLHLTLFQASLTHLAGASIFLNCLVWGEYSCLSD
jgi:hypothetical protein